MRYVKSRMVRGILQLHRQRAQVSYTRHVTYVAILAQVSGDVSDALTARLPWATSIWLGCPAELDGVRHW